MIIFNKRDELYGINKMNIIQINMLVYILHKIIQKDYIENS